MADFSHRQTVPRYKSSRMPSAVVNLCRVTTTPSSKALLGTAVSSVLLLTLLLMLDSGTGGNTGIGLALVAAAKGYKCVLAMPASLAAEKIQTMKTLGAEVILTPGVPFQDPRHYFHVAAGLAHTQRNVFFTNQFENTNNAMAHYKGTAPEIWAQTGGDIDGFICSSGTGGTIGGCSKFLKERKPDVRCYLIDCEGSALHPYVAQGEGYIERGPSPSSGRTIYDGDAVVQYMERSKGSSICEGIGIDRKTANFGMSLLDGAMQVSDTPPNQTQCSAADRAPHPGLRPGGG